MSADIIDGRTVVDILDDDARDAALKYSTALRVYRQALNKRRRYLSEFGEGSRMYNIAERQLNEAKDRFKRAAANYIRHAELLRELLVGGIDG